MVELNMEIGKQPGQRYEEIKIVDLNKLTVSHMTCMACSGWSQSWLIIIMGYFY